MLGVGYHGHVYQLSATSASGRRDQEQNWKVDGTGNSLLKLYSTEAWINFKYRFIECVKLWIWNYRKYYLDGTGGLPWPTMSGDLGMLLI